MIGVYGGLTDPLPMMTLFDKQVTIRMGQANVRRWVDDILPVLTDDDPLGVDSFATHHLPLSDAAAAYQMFRDKQDGAVKVVFRPRPGLIDALSSSWGRLHADDQGCRTPAGQGDA